MGYIKSDFKRCFTSPWFAIAIIGVIFSYFLGDWGDLQYNFKSIDIVNFLDISSNIGFFSELTISLSAIPFAMSFCEDWNSQFIKSLIVRGKIATYSISKVITCIVSSIATIFLGKGLLLIFLSFKLPIVSEQSANYRSFIDDTFGFLLVNENYIMYFLIQIFFTAIICSIFALIGLIITTYLPNKFLAITAPMIIYFTVLQIANSLRVPDYMNPRKIMIGQFSVGQAYANVFYVLIIGIIMYLIGLYIFKKGVKRNVEG